MLSSVGAYRALFCSAIAFVIGAAWATTGTAQTTSAFTACSQGVLANCLVIELTSQLGIGPGGTNFFEIAIQNLGSQTTPSVATTIYNLVFATGQSDALPGSEIDASVVPVQHGGASVVDASPWDLFDAGSAIFLSALSGNGVGGCVAGAPVGGFGQAGQTCGGGQFIEFGFFTTRVDDPTVFSLLDLEVVGLTDDLPADSCNEVAPCQISAAPVTATPEPGSVALVLIGLTGLAGFRLRRRHQAS